MTRLFKRYAAVARAERPTLNVSQEAKVERRRAIARALDQVDFTDRVGMVHHDVGAPVDGPAKEGAGNGVIDDQRDAMFVGDAGHRGDIQHVALGVAHRFGVQRLGAGADGLAEVFRIGGVDEHWMPNLGRVMLNRFQVPPYRLVAETISSPAAAMFMMAKVSAVCPADTPSAPTPPSRAAIRCSKTSVVGFMIRV